MLMKSAETLKKAGPPLAAAVTGAAIGSILRGRKAKRQSHVVRRFAQAAFARADRTHEENRQLRHEVEHDDLTGLRTKKSLVKRGNARLSKAGPDQVFAVAAFDLDNFKAINDQHPDHYDEGDRTLKSFAKVLVRSVRSQDRTTDLLARGSREDDAETDAARLGGDEFAGLFEITPRNEKGEAMSPEERAGVFGDRVRAGLKEEFSDRSDLEELGGVDVSMGIVIVQPDESMESAISRAAVLLHEQKAQHHAENGTYRS